MIRLDKTVRLTATSVSQDWTNPGPARDVHIVTDVELLVALDQDPTDDSFLLAPGTARLVVEPGREFRFKTRGGESGIVTLTLYGRD